MNQNQMIENYDCPNCPSDAKNENVNELQKVYTPCPECGGIYLAKKIRTQYDNYWISYYNNKAQNYPTNLMNLQFAPYQ
jgi:predicted RNA-binding Zn-ribbon protein involved in translation (DUF1610 family)